ncbi:MAG: glycerol-3-phosphate acyltransferase [Anaerolineales bacterium]|nr:glycerol-3-phosphate acyltransferase [Anaerolineales bacterium]
MNILLWSLIGFLSGAVPYSLLIGRLAGAGDIRRQADHNPGAFNVLRATNWRWFTLAMLLDGFKGAIPVGLAWFGGQVAGWGILPVALAPLLGHAYSPFLKGQGGKAVATTFGIWAGLTTGVVPTVLGLLLGWMYAVVTVSGWAMLLAFGLAGIFINIYYGPAYPQLIGVWLLNLLLIAWRHRADLQQRPALRSWLLNLFHRKVAKESTKGHEGSRR